MDAKYHTNGSNLHLNRAGDSILAKSFLCEIRMWLYEYCKTSCLGGKLCDKNFVTAAADTRGSNTIEHSNNYVYDATGVI